MKIKENAIISKILNDRSKYEILNDLEGQVIIDRIEKELIKPILFSENKDISESFYLIDNYHYKVNYNLSVIGVPPTISKEVK